MPPQLNPHTSSTSLSKSNPSELPDIAQSNSEIPFESKIPFEVDVSFVSDQEIAVLNADYRNKPRPTDVLSFSQSENASGEGWPNEATFFVGSSSAPIASSKDEASDGFAAFPGFADEMDSFLLGDIVISIETAARQARERDHDLETEVAFLAVHGALHLSGYDHATSAQRRAMWKQQEAIVEQLTPKAKEKR